MSNVSTVIDTKANSNHKIHTWIDIDCQAPKVDEATYVDLKKGRIQVSQFIIFKPYQGEEYTAKN